METQGNDDGCCAPGGRIASRLWAAARTEFSSRGYHGARVQGIAKRAGCNVALLYRHWASKRALYVEILKSIWLEGAKEIAAQIETTGGAQRRRLRLPRHPHEGPRGEPDRDPGTARRRAVPPRDHRLRPDRGHAR